jgi:DNA polymerase-3 subunit epsilon
MKLAKSYQDLQQATYFGGGDVATGYSLTALSKKFGLPAFEQHDALGDAFQTACLFAFLVNKLQSFGGCRTLKDLRSATSISPFW